ncbi:Uncharacterised protein [Mycobacteroides abscessus subsp. massiliense]|nr:Uncharacterised protein [Mycobacteroides abscessus subsp. massiliense]
MCMCIPMVFIQIHGGRRDPVHMCGNRGQPGVFDVLAPRTQQLGGLTKGPHGLRQVASGAPQVFPHAPKMLTCLRFCIAQR